MFKPKKPINKSISTKTPCLTLEDEIKPEEPFVFRLMTAIVIKLKKTINEPKKTKSLNSTNPRLKEAKWARKLNEIIVSTITSLNSSLAQNKTYSNPLQKNKR